MGDAAKISALIVCLVATVTLGCGMAAAAADDLYQARTIVTGQGEESGAVGFADCLQQVLVKVSGDPRLSGDPRIAALAGQAGTFVAVFDYRDRMAGIPVHDEQGTRDRPYDLTVSFDPAKVDAALRSLGREPWRGPRPRVAVLLGVRLAGATYVLAGDGARGRDQREALMAAAARFGIPMALPDEAAVEESDLSFQSLSAVSPPSTGTGVTIVPPSTGEAGLVSSESSSSTLVMSLGLAALTFVSASLVQRRLAARRR